MTATLTTLVDFPYYTSGILSIGNLIADSNGDLFGASPQGPENNVGDYDGLVFEIAKTTDGYASTPTTLASFDAGTDIPQGGLIADANGDLLGETYGGGANNDGTVFEIARTADGYASTPSTLASFDGADGRIPQGSLIADARGDLFGAANAGGAYGFGTVFEIAKTQTGYASAPTTLVSFDRADGVQPVGSLIADANGDLFGTTEYGGAHGVGTAFEITRTAGGYASAPTVLVSFRGGLVDVGYPQVGLVADANGDLFGITSASPPDAGGIPDGSVFEIVKTAAGYASADTVLTTFNFNGPNGAKPAGGLIIDAAGDLFGVTEQGGAYGFGTVFEIKKTSTGYASAPTTIVSFDGIDGGSPEASLLADANGDLIGTTAGGGPNGSYGTVFEITDSGFVVSSSGVPPTIAGTVADQTTTSEASIDPFSTVTIGDPNAGATDTLSITFAAVDGSLSGADLAGSNGSYTLSGTAAAITGELDALVFKPVDGVPGTSVTTTFTLSDASSGYPTPVADDPTSVIDTDPAGPTTKTIATNGVTTLAQVANEYQLQSVSTGTGPWLVYQGSAVTVGKFGAGWAPVGAKETGNGYEVAWANQGANEYTVWNTDSNGDRTGSVTGNVFLTGSSSELEGVEGNFGDGVFPGAGPPATPTTIATNGVTTLAKVGNLYELNPAAGGSGPLLEYMGSVVTVDQFGAGWAPVGARETGNGYEVAWANQGANEYTVWSTDSDGDRTGSVTGNVFLTGSGSELEGVEGNFGDGTFAGGGLPATPATIATNTGGVKTLARVGSLYELYPATGGGSGPLLEYQGSVVTVGQFGAGWSPVGAEKTASGGYEVAWGNPNANEYTVWNTDSNGDYTSSAMGIVSSTSYALEDLELSFEEDLNRDGTIGPTTKTIATNGVTTLAQAANEYQLQSVSSGTGPWLVYQGSAVTVGQFGTGWSPVGAEKTASGGYEVAWGNPNANEYTVWNTDRNGKYTSSAMGIVSGQSFALEDLEPAFGEDLNGDHLLSKNLMTSAGPEGVVDLTAQTLPTTINLGHNSASANAGLNAPSLTFTGTPDAITLGSDADIIEYALAPSSGIETITNFVLGQDELNIDLGGAANSTFEIYNTMVGGQHAIAFAGSADSAHGVVLLHMAASDTAAALLASHTVFSGGHALIS